MTPIFSNGFLLRDTRVDLGSHMDSYHLRNLMMTKKPTSLGIIEYWAQTQQAQPFLYNFASFGGKNRKMVDDVDGKYTWDVPVVNDIPHITRDIDPTNTTKGKGKVPFRIALNRRAYGPTAVISFDKMAGVEMLVKEVEEVGNGEVYYTVTIHNGDKNTFLDNAYLVPTTPIFRKFSLKSGDYGETWDDSTSRIGMRTFYNFLGDGMANKTYSISSKAHDMMQAKGGVPIREMIKFNEWDPNDISRVNIPDQAAKVRQIGLLKAMEEGIISYSFVLETEQRCLSDIIRDIEEYMMWGLGGYSESDGPDGIRTPVGLWRQLDNSFKRVYNIGTWNMGILQSELYNYYNGRVDFTGPDPKREVIVQTGIGGMTQVNSAIQGMAGASGVVINGVEIGAITNTNGKGSIPLTGMDLRFGFAYTSYVIPFLANVKFVVNPALDPVLANDIENPYVNGFRTSSYCYIIWDVTANGGNDNIYLMEWYYDKGLKWFYQNGTSNYNGDQKGFLSVGDFSGYNVKMEQYHKGVQVLDPTRILKIVPYNVRTNRPFGS